MELEAQASRWTSKCVYGHEGAEGTRDNLARSAGMPVNFTETALKPWWDEIKFFKNMECLPGKMCLHFTQVCNYKIC